MVTAIVLAHLWGVLAVTALGSFGRTVRLRTVLLAFLAGFYVCGPLALFVQYAWTTLYVTFTDASLRDTVLTGGYTVDPFVEELAKVAPLVLVLVWGIGRHRWTLTDCILIAAASGAGFGLIEDILRYGQAAGRALPGENGWTLTTNISLPHVTGFREALNAWLPPAVTSGDDYMQIPGAGPWINVHLAWSLLAGLAVGLIFLRKGVVPLAVGGVLFFLVGLDHAVANSWGGTWVRETVGRPMGGFHSRLSTLTFLAFVAAFVLDRRSVSRDEKLWLPEEAATTPAFLGLLTAAAGRLPWSAIFVFDYARRRHVYQRLRHDESCDLAAFEAVLIARRDALITAAPRTGMPTVAPSRRTLAIAGLMAAAALPSLAWIVAGGWPQTIGVQTAMATGWGWLLVRLASLVAAALC
jgi:hypothetical protein